MKPCLWWILAKKQLFLALDTFLKNDGVVDGGSSTDINTPSSILTDNKVPTTMIPDLMGGNDYSVKVA